MASRPARYGAAYPEPGVGIVKRRSKSTLQHRGRAVASMTGQHDRVNLFGRCAGLANLDHRESYNDVVPGEEAASSHNAARRPPGLFLLADQNRSPVGNSWKALLCA